MKKFFRKAHLWLSVPFGIIISLICFSGAMLVFETEVTEAVRGSSASVEPTSEGPLPIGRLIGEGRKSLPDSVDISGVVIPSSPSSPWQLSLTKPRRASLYVNQYTGAVIGPSQRLPFFQTMFGLHRWLLMAPTGKLVVGVSTLLFVVILATGLVVWWPRNKKALLNSLKIDSRHGWRRLWHDLHVAGGVYAVLLLLAMALTGLTWSFEWYRNGFYALFGVESSEMQGGHGGQQDMRQQSRQGQGRQGQGRHDALTDNSQPDRQNFREGRRPTDESGEGGHRRGRYADADSTAAPHDGGRHRHADVDSQTGGTLLNDRHHHADPYSSWDKACRAVSEKYNGDFKNISLQDGRISVALGGLGNVRASDSYTFDQATGQLTGESLYKDAKRANKVRGWIFSVHTGAWGGLLTRILAFLAAMLGASLPITGYYLWIKRLLGKKKAKAAKA